MEPDRERKLKMLVLKIEKPARPTIFLSAWLPFALWRAANVPPEYLPQATQAASRPTKPTRPTTKNNLPRHMRLELNGWIDGVQ
jgi:hypothetical protein